MPERIEGANGKKEKPENGKKEKPAAAGTVTSSYAAKIAQQSAAKAEFKPVKLDPTAAVWKPSKVTTTVAGASTATPNATEKPLPQAAAANATDVPTSSAAAAPVSAWGKKLALDAIKAAPPPALASVAKPVAAAKTPAAPNKTSKDQSSKSAATAKGEKHGNKQGSQAQQQNKGNQHQNARGGQQQQAKKGGANTHKRPSSNQASQPAPAAAATPAATPSNWANAAAKTAVTTAAAAKPPATTAAAPTPAPKVKAVDQQQQQPQAQPPQAHGHGHNHKHKHGKDHHGKKFDVADAHLLNPEDQEDASQDVKRFTSDTLLQFRMLFLNAPEEWALQEPAAADNGTKKGREWMWTSATRVDDIKSQHARPRSHVPYEYGDHAEKDQMTNKKEGNKGHRSSNAENGGRVAPKGELIRKEGSNDPNIFINEHGEEIFVKPLEVNEETRWRPKVAASSDAVDAGEAKDASDAAKKDAAALQRALLVLNKLTPTNFPKLSEEFVGIIVQSEALLVEGIKLLIAKAQQEPHFCPMYAQVCQRLASEPLPFDDTEKKPGKTFKRHLLEECQHEFEIPTSAKIAKALEGVANKDDPEEVDYRKRLVKKTYLGHMTFIGEIYKVNICSIKVMLMCLPILLTGKIDDEATQAPEGGTDEDEEAIDEEKVECFAKLMATIGHRLEEECEDYEQRGKAEYLKQLDLVWERVTQLSKGDLSKLASNRIKFMLLDLMELRANGWVARRKQETAKTLQEIHSEAAKELPGPRRTSSTASLRSLGQSSSSLVRGSSSGDVRQLVDNDGFVTVGKIVRSQSQTSLRRATSGGSLTGISPTAPGNYRRSTSDVSPGSRNGRKKSLLSKEAEKANGPFFALQDSLPFDTVQEHKESTGEPDDALTRGKETEVIIVDSSPALSPSECGLKVKAILKEYLVNHDISDATVSYEELVQPSKANSLDRAEKCVSQSLKFMMESSKTHLETFLGLWKTLVCGEKQKPALFDRPVVLLGIRQPLEALADIIIDAPLAKALLVEILASTMSWGALPANISFLLDMPEFFQTDGYAATFAVNLLQAFEKLDGSSQSGLLSVTENVEVVEKLMTSDEKEEWENAAAFIRHVTGS